jgi:trigger factor
MMERKLRDDEIIMHVSDGESCEKVISVEIARERFEDEKAKVLGEMIKEVSIPGFRKGKVPAEIVQRRFAEEIRSEALKSILPLAYRHVVSSKNLDPIGDPEFHDVDIGEDKPLTFKVRMEVVPKLDIADYRGVEVPAEEINVRDEEIEEVLKSLRERASDFVAVERTAAAGDIITIDFAPIGKDGLPNEKQRTKNYHVQLGGGQIFPAFEEALTGKKKGDTGRVDIVYPQDYEPKRLAGTTVTYEFAVGEVREKRLPDLDDALAARIDERFATLDALRADVRTRLVAEKEKEARHRREETAVDLLIERNPFDIPRTMRERFKKELYEEDERRRQAAGVGPEEDPKRRRQMEELFDRVSGRNIKRYFIMEHIAEKEGVDVTNADIDAELAAVAAESGRTIEDLKKYLAGNHERRSNLRSRLRERKILSIILGES